MTGLEGAVVDADVMRVGALGSADARFFDIRVAGPAALLVAKVHKIGERQGKDRQVDKDALDVLRLLRGTQTLELASRYQRLLADTRSAEAARVGRALLRAQFAMRAGPGVEMAVRSAGPLANAEELSASCEALAGDLIAALGR